MLKDNTLLDGQQGQEFGEEYVDTGIPELGSDSGLQAIAAPSAPARQRQPSHTASRISPKQAPGDTFNIAEVKTPKSYAEALKQPAPTQTVAASSKETTSKETAAASLKVSWISTTDQAADGLTKPLDRVKLARSRQLLGVVDCGAAVTAPPWLARRLRVSKHL
ncbi:hypothetical protein LTR08_004909 [Meristemomyces frigidus]|nr:hypothetical protein LTR08_004909 [Meristemomyces frigidus]